MSTNVSTRYFKSISALKDFMDQNNIQSGDVVGVVDGPDGPGLVYSASVVDTQGPTLKVSAIPDGQTAGTSIRVTIQVGENSSLGAVTDDPATSALVLSYRTQGAGTWIQTIPEWQSPTIYSTFIPGSVVQSPGVEYYVTAKDGAGNQTDFGTASSPKTFTV